MTEVMNVVVTQLYHPLKEPVPLLLSALNLVMTHTLETLLRTRTL